MAWAPEDPTYSQHATLCRYEKVQNGLSDVLDVSIAEPTPPQTA